MSPTDDPFVFVSYSSKDSDVVHAEIKRLERQGYQVWYDKGSLRPSLIWDEEIDRAIKACACFIVFITHDAVASEKVCYEIDKALEAKKPLICIYWDKVELPSRFEEPLRKIQALERYSMRRPVLEYEVPLSRTLSEYLKKTEPVFEERDERVEQELIRPQADTRPDSLPNIVFFTLILVGVVFLFLAFVAFVAPYIVSPVPGDPLGNRLAGFVAGLVFTLLACGLGAVAFVVYRKYLRRKDG